jgi:hypothetical protein
MEVVDDASDEDRPVPFPTIAQLSQDRYEQVRLVPEHHRNPVAAHIPSGPSSGPGEEGHSHQSGEFYISTKFAHNLTHVTY